MRQPDGSERVYSTWAEAAPSLQAWGVEIRGRAESSEGSVMGAGRGRELVRLELTRAEESARAVQDLNRLLEQLGLTIIYHSVYGDEFRAVLEREDG